MQRIALRRGVHSLPGCLASKSDRHLINTTRICQRTYADAAPPKDHARQGNLSRAPLITLAGILTIVPAYYFLHSDKAPASGHQSRKEARIGADPSKEYRDPRDSGVKTLEQKRKRDEAGQ